MAEIVTSEGKLYLATVIDLFSRRLLGYAMGERHDAELVVASLHMAAATRGGDVRGALFHSDRGSPIPVTALQTGLPLARRDPVHGPCRLVFRLPSARRSTAYSRPRMSTGAPSPPAPRRGST
ncbi:DDE-type integrase/transposase/recombinase [Streptomyces sp. NPDC005799]|uniref:DDE-type integrase/transposase/recombinase n=1 Tax=Streptomyces sp. NPDC005799 TaxID=3154678 RepID=UPI0034063466